ncbi:MAG: deoxyribose-phosphate aldolase [Firmicutes bacterium]|nr:deoxyribose-phosphate aldolase [Bacillota bacterium]
MNIQKIVTAVDHTLLLQTSTWDQIKKLCDEGIEYNTASVCIPPSFVERAKEYTDGKLPICTVIGFPNGYATTEVKVFETIDALAKGADEIDMVINIGDLKDKRYDVLLDEIKRIKAVCGNKILKVIIETCLLTEEEKIKMCEIITQSGADFIKTSTGFSTAGATEADLRLFAANVGKDVKIKAAGGIKNLETAELFMEIGASRLGTSSIINLIRDTEVQGY